MKNVTLTPEQVTAVGFAMLDAQVAKLLAIGAPPLPVIDVLLDIMTNLIAGCEPATERRTLVKTIAEKVEKEVTRKAGARMMASATMVPPPRLV